MRVSSSQRVRLGSVLSQVWWRSVAGVEALCRRCDKIAYRATDEVVAKSYLMLFDVICIKSKCQKSV